MDIFDNLSEKQKEAVQTIDEDLEIIACAGAGKTGVVTRRIVNILRVRPDIQPEIADYEVINYTLKPKTKLNNFCSFLYYTAAQYYPEGYLTNSYAKPDAVSIMTIHQSKGLEFAAVFIPQLNKNFFPAQRVGGKGIWHVIDKTWITNSERFNGDIEEERKLFYVAVTRAKKYLYLTRSETSHDKYISPFLEEAKESSYLIKYDGNIEYDRDNLPNIKKETMPISLNFSLLEDYFECPYRFKLSMFYGFVQPIVRARRWN